MAEADQGKSDRALLEALGVELKPEKKAARTPQEERIIAGFEEIQRFVEEHGHAPEHGEEKAIFERLYATRLDQISNRPECKALLEGIDHQGLLTGSGNVAEPPAGYDSDEALLAELGVKRRKKAISAFSSMLNLRWISGRIRKRRKKLPTGHPAKISKRSNRASIRFKAI